MTNNLKSKIVSLWVRNSLGDVSDHTVINAVGDIANEIILEDELAKKAWILTYTGKEFHAFDPKPEQISLKDIAHALSRNNRFTGHSEKSYTVGEHSIHCYNLLCAMKADKDTCLIGLLHDASEAYLQDIASPFKKFLPEYQELEKTVQNAIYLKYLGYIPTEEHYSEVKMVDEIMLVNEMEQLMPNHKDINKSVPNIYVDLSSDYDKDRVSEVFLEIATSLGAID